MADNYTAILGDGTTGTFGADDVSSVLYPRVKLQIGADGERADVDGGQQAMANSVPVVMASDQDFVKAEDAAHSSGDKGIPALAVRKDTAAALAGTDGDYTPLESDASGRLHALAHSGATDDAAAAGQLYPVAGLYQATVDEVDDGDVGRIRMVKRRGLITAADYSVLTLTSAAPTPTGTDILDNSGNAIEAGDLAIRDTSSRYFRIPYASAGWRHISLMLSTSGAAFDQNVTVRVFGMNASGVAVPLLLSTTWPASGAFYAMITSSGAAGVGATVGGATAAAGAHYSVPALANYATQYVALLLLCGSAPSAGAFTIQVERST